MVDSDFSIDEHDEPVSEHEDEEGKKRKRGGHLGVQTKAYKVEIIINNYNSIWIREIEVLSADFGDF